MQAYHEMRKAFDKIEKGHIEGVPVKYLNEIARVFSLYKNGDKIKAALEEFGLEPIYIDLLIRRLPNFSKFGNLSVKALDKIIPHLEKGFNYDEACHEAGYDFKGDTAEEPQQYIDLQDLQEKAQNKITSPVSKRALSQCAKVINAIIREMDGVSPVFINIELARELHKSSEKQTPLDLIL